MTPVDALQEVAELGGRDRDGAVGGRRPQESAPFEALGVKRQAEPVVPKDFDEIAATAAEDIQIAGVGIAAESLLDLEQCPGACRYGLLPARPARRRGWGSPALQHIENPGQGAPVDIGIDDETLPLGKDDHHPPPP